MFGHGQVFLISTLQATAIGFHPGIGDITPAGIRLGHPTDIILTAADFTVTTMAFMGIADITTLFLTCITTIMEDAFLQVMFKKLLLITEDVQIIMVTTGRVLRKAEQTEEKAFVAMVL
ncbi:hypothetical protein CNR22_05670 [Sphingobacteriaceae bacterium]|nr:hypothetical protein CNR22_05670 [Sphingobacteriaceae bacterium]